MGDGTANIRLDVIKSRNRIHEMEMRLTFKPE
jgi:hypothetical protein